jgi:phosphoribosylformylglycinamidine (FGAM) synthase-like amidotransferase family enzyme
LGASNNLRKNWRNNQQGGGVKRGSCKNRVRKPIRHRAGRECNGFWHKTKGLSLPWVEKIGAGFFVTLCFVDNSRADRAYSLNPNGSPQGITGLTTPDGRFSIMMPHPERVFRAVQNSWYSKEWRQNGAWLRMFLNARKRVG